MGRTKRIVALFFLAGFSVTAQIRGVVKDSLSGKPIPYVNIWVENENIGTTSEENGAFSINAEDKNKVLVFSALGFESTKIKASESKKVNMKAVVFQLDEVVIHKSRNERTKLIGDSKKSTSSSISGRSPRIYAKLFKYENSFTETPLIKNAIIYTKSKIKNACFKLRIYKVNEDGLPGEDLINKNIVVFVGSGMKKNTIELLEYNLSIPPEGVFVAFEWMLIENNKDELDFAPSLVFNYKNRDLTVTYSNGKWTKRPKIDFELNKKVKETVIEPAINLTLTN